MQSPLFYAIGRLDGGETGETAEQSLARGGAPRKEKEKGVAQGVQAARTVSSSWQVHWYDTDLVAARAPVALRVGG